MQVTPGHAQDPVRLPQMYGVPRQGRPVDPKIAQGVIEWPSPVALGSGKASTGGTSPSSSHQRHAIQRVNVAYIGLEPELGARGESQLDIQMVMGVAAVDLLRVLGVQPSQSSGRTSPTSSTRC